MNTQASIFDEGHATKIARVLDHMQATGAWVSALDSLRMFGLMSLSQQMGKLKARGVAIESRMVSGHAEYRLRPGERK